MKPVPGRAKGTPRRDLADDLGTAIGLLLVLALLLALALPLGIVNAWRRWLGW